MTTVQDSLDADRRVAPMRHLRRVRPICQDLRFWSEPGVLRVAGEVDHWTVPFFREALSACDDDPCIQALDLTDVGFFSAAGVGCFVDHGWTVRPHAAIIASRPVQRVLTLCDLEYLLGRHGWCEAYDGWRVRRYPAF